MFNLVLSWLVDIADYIKNNSYGLPAVRVLEYNGITFGIVEPYGYYILNYNSSLFLLRDKNTAIKFYVLKDTVFTSIEQTGRITQTYIDFLFQNPPKSASIIEKFILFRDENPRKHTVINIINKCLDLQIFELQ